VKIHDRLRRVTSIAGLLQMIRFRTFIIGGTLALAIFLFAQRKAPVTMTSPYAAVIDLTHTISQKAPNWEGTEKSPFQAEVNGTYEKDGYFSRKFSTDEHFGTHMDAPAHFSRGRWTVDQIPTERLVRPLVVLDVSAKARENADYLVTVNDIGDWEQINGQIAPGAVVIARTGWSEKWKSPKDFRNADASNVPHFPAYSMDAARFLVQARQVVAIGIDTLSIDPGPSKDFPVHKFTSAQSVYALENVDASRAPEVGATIIVSPAKIEGGSGAPVRLLALVQ
jgi:kynurenine formamidase